jgi:predicted metalloprotease
MPAFLQAADDMVKPFFRESYPNVPAARDVVLVGSRGGRSVCGLHTLDSYEYCPGNDTIYIGQELLWGFYRLGDAAPVVGLAHEYGHHLQTYLRLPFPRTARESVRYENQADCIAGAWAKYASEKGWLEEADDLKDIEGLMRAIGSRETSSRDHGTTAERVAAFNTGFKSGLNGCTE